jgi:hypothetical protein
MNGGKNERPRPGPVTALALLALAAGCAGGHVQAGPTIGFAFKRGTTVGWEAGSGVMGVARLSTGGTYRLEPAPPVQEEGAKAGPRNEDDSEPRPSPDAIHYLALEPLGVSLGIAIPNVGPPGFMGGVWAGWMFDPNPNGAFSSDPNPDRFQPTFDCPDYDPEPAFLLSGAVGLRYMSGEWEAYFTPKGVVFWCLEFAN